VPEPSADERRPPTITTKMITLAQPACVLQKAAQDHLPLAAGLTVNSRFRTGRGRRRHRRLRRSVARGLFAQSVRRRLQFRHI